MTKTRIYITKELQSEQEIVLDSASSKHILQVLRLKIGDEIILFNGSNKEFGATIVRIDKKLAVVRIETSVQCNTESPLKIHLLQGISRGEKMDFTIQKAVELGVYTITPIFTEHCNVKLKGERLSKKLDHWQKIAINAAEQSGRCYVPKVFPAEDFSGFDFMANSELNFILEPGAAKKIYDIKEQPKNISILIGPEGGFSPRELEIAKKNSFIPVVLGPRILRTETAAFAVISALQSKWGDF